MDCRRSVSLDFAQALITDFFHQLRNEEESCSQFEFHQTLITDFYHEEAESSVVSQSVFELSMKDSESDFVLREDQQTPMSHHTLSFSECSHVSETPEYRLLRAEFELELEVESQMRKCLW